MKFTGLSARQTWKQLPCGMKTTNIEKSDTPVETYRKQTITEGFADEMPFELHL